MEQSLFSAIAAMGLVCHKPDHDYVLCHHLWYQGI